MGSLCRIFYTTWRRAERFHLRDAKAQRRRDAECCWLRPCALASLRLRLLRPYSLTVSLTIAADSVVSTPTESVPVESGGTAAERHCPICSWNCPDKAARSTDAVSVPSMRAVTLVSPTDALSYVLSAWSAASNAVLADE